MKCLIAEGGAEVPGEAPLRGSGQSDINIRACAESSTVRVQIDAPFAAEEFAPGHADKGIPDARLAGRGRIPFYIGCNLECHPACATFQREVGEDFKSAHDLPV